MSLSMYQASIPVLTRALQNLRHVLGKAAEHCDTNKIEHDVLVGFRLYPNMRPLSFQVQVACDMSKGCAVRLGGIEAPKFEDKERTFPELQARIDATLEVLAGITPAQIDGTETKPIVMKTPRGDLSFEGLSYLQGFVIPNVYFHCATAYSILRHNGVDIGKMDFLGKT